MIKKKWQNYWLWQAAGWGLLTLISITLAISFDVMKENYWLVLLFNVFTGLAISHGMRFLILKLRLFELLIPKQVYGIILISLVASFLQGFVGVEFERFIGFDLQRAEKFSYAERIFIAGLNNSYIFFIWNFIYFTYHHLQNMRRREIDNLRLEALVKTLEVKTIKSHINPHFIFNSLNSIRALVEQDPERARQAITELSKILRSSLSASQQETTTLENELEIVKNYLRLEKLRFEERLNISFNIDKDSLSEEVPPMMLQTLVENAIKHGISKNISGGKVEVIAHTNHENLELIVRNSGKLIDSTNKSGFGIKATQERLKYLYQDKAEFSINELPGDIVESKIVLPIKTSKKSPSYVQSIINR